MMYGNGLIGLSKEDTLPLLQQTLDMEEEAIEDCDTYDEALELVQDSFWATNGFSLQTYLK